MIVPRRPLIEEALGAKVVNARPLSGGSIHQAFCIALSDGRQLFVKTSANVPSSMFRLEAEGLTFLASFDALATPEIVFVDDAFLCLRYYPARDRSREYEEELGHGLASLHAQSQPHFGWREDNYLATLQQDNRDTDSWATFYAERRIHPLTSEAVRKGVAPASFLSKVEQLCQRMDSICGPAEAPSPLHGDLWSGNLHVDTSGMPMLIDPAVYAGNREVDLAMLTLFGSPGPTFFAAYDEVFPRSPGCDQRVKLYQLYPLLLHLLLFGVSYLDSCEDAVERYL